MGFLLKDFSFTTISCLSFSFWKLVSCLKLFQKENTYWINPNKTFTFTFANRGRNKTHSLCINSTKEVVQNHGECQQNTIPSDQMHSLRTISNHPNSQTPHQKLLGKSSVPCHITHIYQDAAQPLRLEVYQIICLQNGWKRTHYYQSTLSELLRSNIPDTAASKSKLRWT